MYIYIGEMYIYIGEYMYKFAKIWRNEILCILLVKQIERFILKIFSFHIIKKNEEAKKENSQRNNTNR